MLKLREQAEAIIARLGTLTDLNQIEYLESVDGDRRRPAKLPLAQLLLDAEPTTARAGGSISSRTSWTILVTSKNMAGPGGLMDLVDEVLDVMEGFQPVVGARPLSWAKVGFVDRGEDPLSCAVTLSTVQDTGWQG